MRNMEKILAGFEKTIKIVCKHDMRSKNVCGEVR